MAKTTEKPKYAGTPAEGLALVRAFSSDGTKEGDRATAEEVRVWAREVDLYLAAARSDGDYQAARIPRAFDKVHQDGLQKLRYVLGDKFQDAWEKTL